jgi:hypothetical protein
MFVGAVVYERNFLDLCTKFQQKTKTSSKMSDFYYLFWHFIEKGGFYILFLRPNQKMSFCLSTGPQVSLKTKLFEFQKCGEWTVKYANSKKMFF